MTWYKMLKLSATMILYHGTGGQNLSSIFSEGLRPDAPKLYDQELDYGSIQSYGGVYLTDNLLTALSSARKSAGKIPENKEIIDHQVLTKQQIVVMVQVETRTPHIIVDEDMFIEPSGCIQKAMGIMLETGTYPNHLAYFLQKNLESNLENIVDCYLNETMGIKYVNMDPRMLQPLRPYIKDFIIKFAYRVLAKQIELYFGEEGWRTSQKEEFDREFPEFANLEMNKAEVEFRNAADLLMKKAHRLTEHLESFQYNIRSLEPIGYTGRNKIILIAEFHDLPVRRSEYSRHINILYSRSEQAIEKLIEDTKRMISSNFKMIYNDNIIYDQKSEGEYALV